MIFCFTLEHIHIEVNNKNVKSREDASNCLFQNGLNENFPVPVFSAL